MRNTNTAASRIFALALLPLLAAAYVGLFGQYAFDDSYIGYSIANSLISHNGFSFNAGDRLISTSAPLAIPLYVFVHAVFRVSIVDAAQILSALALAVIAFGGYGLLLRLSTPLGAALGAAVAISSPFTLVLWSHESLLYLAAAVIGLELYARQARVAAALVLGCATLLRGEGLLILMFLFIYDWQRNGIRSGLKLAALSFAPFVLWAILATALFGGFLSQTLAAKRAEGLYETILPYLYGVQDYALRMYALTPIALWYLLLQAIVLLAVAGEVIGGLFGKRATLVLLWCAATTALYVVLQLPFYFWFCSQAAVALSIVTACAWRVPVRLPRIAWLTRFFAVGIAAFNLAFLIEFALWPGSKFAHYDWIIMPRVQNNAYRSLGDWFGRNSAPSDTIAYAEFGQIHYYSGRDIVDYLGLVTSGAAQHLKDDDAIWTFKRYRPTWVIENPTWHYFVDPVEYDWFRASYSRVTQLVYPPDPERSRFTLYRLRSGATIPPADDRTNQVNIRWASERDGTETFEARTLVPVSALEVRTWHPAPCARARLALRIAGRIVAAGTSSLRGAPGISRLTLTLPNPVRPGAYTVTVSGCAGLTLAPPARLRRGFVFDRYPLPEFGDPPDALIFYRRGLS